MSSLLSAEIVATCNALGYFDVQQGKYYADDNTLETVKDLIRYLRRDDETFTIRRQLGQTNVVQSDLLPLLKNYWQQTDLFDVLLRLLVNLTTPALILWQEEIPIDKGARNQYLQIDEHLRQYKEAFADEGVWAVLTTRISKILEIDPLERGDENGLIIERIVILIRNVLYVPSDPDAEKRPDNDASVHDQVLWSLHQSGLLDIILYMSSSESEQAYYMHILEILCYMLREQNASELANAALQRSETEKIRDEAELLAVRHRESNERQRKTKIYNSTRHSRFGGTFVVKSMKSISDNELIYHKPLNKLQNINFDADKTKKKTPKNRLPVQSVSTERRSAFSIRLFLKEFCVEFLKASYNTLMYQVKHRLARARSQHNDETYYLWALRFFMEFNRCHKFEVKLVSETISVESFHFVEQKMEKFYDMICSDKKKIKQWSRRLQLGLLAYKELLLTTTTMDKSPDESIRNSAKVIKRSYLRDLIETQHIFLKMMESFCGGKEGKVIVQAKKKTKRKKGNNTARPSEPAEIKIERQWDEVSPQLSVILEGNLDFPTVPPFDAGSDTPIDEQKTDAMLNIQRKLRGHDFEEAIGLLRASREVWPEDDCFGSQDMRPEEEFAAIRDIFFADLGENDIASTAIVEATYDSEDDEEDEGGVEMITESEVKFGDFIKRIAHPKVIRACGLILKKFDTNTPFTNHCIIKLLHRIAVDLKMSAMVFQVSLFTTFQKIYEMDTLPQHKELAKFATFIIRRFFEVCHKNDLTFIEALFWKSTKDAYDIEEGYNSNNVGSSAAARVWSEEEENELSRLFMEHQEKQIQEDVVDWIVNNLIDSTKSRRGVIKKLKELCLLQNYKGRKSRPGISGRPPKQWDADEETQLAELYEQFKDAMDPLTLIVDRLDVARPKNRVVEKLLIMGLVQDKKELRKKRSAKSKISRSGPTNGDDDNSIDDDSEDDSQVQPRVQDKHAPRTKARIHKKKALNQGEMAGLLLGLVDLRDALDWIRESFSDAIEDKTNDPDDTEGIPLVPILDCAVSAMENPEFLKALRLFGVQEPCDEQEIYWRIPACIDSTELRSYCDILTKAIDGTLTVQQETATTVEKEESSDDEDVFNTLRKLTANKPIDIPSGNNESANSTEIFNTAIESKPKKKSIKKDMSELIKKISKKKSKDNDVQLDIIDNSKKPEKSKATKRRVQINDSSDEDIPRDAAEENPDEFAVFKPARIEDSDSDRDTQTIRNIIDSDSDDETVSQPFKPMKVIESDDDDDETRTVQSSSKLESNDSNKVKNTRKLNSSRIISSDEDEEINGKRSRTTSDSETEKPIKKKSKLIGSDSE